jgi:hypothetical protein
MSAAGIALGLVFVHRTYFSFVTSGFGRDVLFNALIAAICVLGSSVSRRLYLTDRGVTRETRYWGRTLRRELPWRDVKYVSLAFRGDKMMAFFEVGSTGWKVPFSKDQETRVRDILDEYLPDVEINVGERKG